MPETEPAVAGMAPAGVVPRSMIGRALRVLMVFSPGQAELSLSTIARRSGLPLTTTYRIVSELTRWGALERTSSGGYQVGLRLWEIGALAPRGRRLRDIAMSFLEDLYAVTRQNVQLAVLDGMDVVYLERIVARDATSVLARMNGRLPLHATGVGLVLLAFADADFQERVLAAPARRSARKPVGSPDELRRAIAEVRRRGFAVSDGRSAWGVRSVAAPIFNAQRRVPAALSVVVPSERSPREYVPAVQAAARGISRGLGWQPD